MDLDIGTGNGGGISDMKRFAVIFNGMVTTFCLLTLLASGTSADRPDIVVKAENINSSDGLEWEFVVEGLAVGDLVYVDRDYIYTDIPEEFIGMPYMRTSNDSKLVEDLEVTFEIDRPAYIYTFWCPNIQPPRPWLEENFELVMEKAVVVTWGTGPECDVWKSKEPFEDIVTLGPSGDSLGMYIGVVLEAAAIAVHSEGKLCARWSQIKRIY
jgi:hypothetical protein